MRLLLLLPLLIIVGCAAPSTPKSGPQLYPDGAFEKTLHLVNVLPDSKGGLTCYYGYGVEQVTSYATGSCPSTIIVPR